MSSTPKLLTDDELHASLERLSISYDLQRSRAVEFVDGKEVEAESDCFEVIVPDLVDNLVVVDIITDRVQGRDQ